MPYPEGDDFIREEKKIVKERIRFKTKSRIIILSIFKGVLGLFLKKKKALFYLVKSKFCE